MPGSFQRGPVTLSQRLLREQSSAGLPSIHPVPRTGPSNGSRGMHNGRLLRMKMILIVMIPILCLVQEKVELMEEKHQQHWQ